jgi:hypothetical protein
MRALALALALAVAPVAAHATPVDSTHQTHAAAATAGELKAALNTLLQEHVYLAAGATGAALGGRQAEFQAAAAALDGNSQDIAKAIGSVYGADAGTAFLGLWRRHIGFVVDYTTGLATKDTAKQTQAVNALLGYTQEFAAFLSGANPNLPKDAVAELVKTHILTLKDVIDAQASKDPQQTWATLRMAGMHMSMIANPLADAIVKQFPSRFAN